jgi:Bacterial transglutaminase-like cysteine proteinase BTLCP
MGRYVSQPLNVKCKSIHEVRQFLRDCEYVSDKELFDKNEYWQPPEEFEQRKKGDCEDSALWTWRQLLQLGYDARFVGGSCGRYGEGHAWVEYFKDGKCFLVEPLFRKIGGTMPRLSTLRYSPKVSVSWDGKTLRYFAHKKPESRIGWKVLTPLIWDYLLFWGSFWLRNLHRLPLVPLRMSQRLIFRRDLWLQRKRRDR